MSPNPEFDEFSGPYGYEGEQHDKSHKGHRQRKAKTRPSPQNPMAMSQNNHIGLLSAASERPPKNVRRDRFRSVPQNHPGGDHRENGTLHNSAKAVPNPSPLRNDKIDTRGPDGRP